MRASVGLAASWFVYTFAAAAFLIVVFGVNSQGSSGNISLWLVFAIVLISPVPMLVTGWAFLRKWRRAILLASALAVTQTLCWLVASRIAANSIGDLDTFSAALFYVCAVQKFYLPGSLLLAPLSAVILLRRRETQNVLDQDHRT